TPRSKRVACESAANSDSTSRRSSASFAQSSSSSPARDAGEASATASKIEPMRCQRGSMSGTRFVETEFAHQKGARATPVAEHRAFREPLQHRDFRNSEAAEN